MVDQAPQGALLANQSPHQVAHWFWRTVQQVLQAIIQELGLGGIGPPGQAAGSGEEGQEFQLRGRFETGAMAVGDLFLLADLLCQRPAQRRFQLGDQLCLKVPGINRAKVYFQQLNPVNPVGVAQLCAAPIDQRDDPSAVDPAHFGLKLPSVRRLLNLQLDNLALDDMVLLAHNVPATASLTEPRAWAGLAR